MTGLLLGERMQRDHDRLDQSFEAFRASARDPPPRRSELFRPFAVGLRAHFRFEETEMFPAYGGEDRTRGGTVQLLLDEHRRIERCLRLIEERLATGSTDTRDREEELVNVLWAHDAREEGLVYPWIDLDASPEIRERLDASFRALAPEDG